MPDHTIARRIAAVLPALAFLACSDPSPVAPGAATDNDQDMPVLAQSVPGTYVLDYYLTNGELNFRAHVFSASGDATGGRVTFQVCVAKGGATLQMVPLPASECESGGSGNWVHLAGITMGSCPDLGSGYACILFGTAPVTATLGARFRYTGQGSGISNGESNTVDFVP